MWVTIEIDPSDPRLDTTGSKAECHREPVPDMHDRPDIMQWLYDIEVKCHSFDGCPVIDYDYDALYQHLERTVSDE